MGLIIGQGGSKSGGGGGGATNIANTYFNTQSTQDIKELVVDAETIDKFWNIYSPFPYLEKLTLKCKVINIPTNQNMTYLPKTLKEINVPNLEKVDWNGILLSGVVANNNVIESFLAPKLEYVYIKRNDCGFVYACDNLKEVICPNLGRFSSGLLNSGFFAKTQPNLRKVVFGKITSVQQTYAIFSTNSTAGTRPNLIHLEIGEGTNDNLPFQFGGFTNVTLTDTNELVEDKEAHPTWSNLDQWLHNFEHLIVDKLADLSGQTAKTITLQASCYNAIPTELRQKLSAKNWNLASA